MRSRAWFKLRLESSLCFNHIGYSFMLKKRERKEKEKKRIESKIKQ